MKIAISGTVSKQKKFREMQAGDVYQTPMQKQPIYLQRLVIHLRLA